LKFQNIEGAYNEILSSKDNAFLLRLMMTIGPCFDDLKEKTCIKVLSRMLELTNSDFIGKTCLGFFQEAKQENLLNSLSLEDKNYLIRMLGS